MSASHTIHDYRDIDAKSLQKDFHIGTMSDCDSYRESEIIPTYQGNKLRFKSPWMHCPFGWGQYNTIVLSSQSNRAFPWDVPADKKKFRAFFTALDQFIQHEVGKLPNPDMLSMTISSHVTYNEQFNNFQYKFPIQKKFIDANGNFEGKVFKCTNIDNPEYIPSSVKDIESKSYVSFVGYVGKVTQSRNTIRYKIIIEQICWFPINNFVNDEQEELLCDVNMFLDLPTLTSSKKRTTPTNIDVEYATNKRVKPTKHNSEDEDEDVNINSDSES